MKRVTVSMSDNLDNALEFLSDEWGVTKSNLVSCIVGQYFRSMHDEIFKECLEESEFIHIKGKYGEPFMKATAKWIGEQKRFKVK